MYVCAWQAWRLRQINRVWNYPHQNAKVMLGEVRRLDRGRRVKRERAPEIALLIQLPRNALLRSLVFERPRFEHAARADDSRNIQAPSQARDPMVVRQPQPVVMNDVDSANRSNGGFERSLSDNFSTLLTDRTIRRPEPDIVSEICKRRGKAGD